MGKEIGLRFAKRGFNLILVARNIEKLKLAQKEIIDQYPVDV
jgi:short-subunit dehydrogenase